LECSQRAAPFFTDVGRGDESTMEGDDSTMEGDISTA